MSGDWIKVEKVTARKPEVLRIAALLGIHPDHAFGICIRFWSWCDDNLENGNAVGVTDVMLDALLERDGCAATLIEVGWLRVRNGSLEVPNYDRHLSENAKKRALSRSRTAKSRSRNCNALSVTKVLPEKRREEREKERERERDVGTPAKLVSNQDPRQATVPAGFNVPQFRDAWSRWCDFRLTQDGRDLPMVQAEAVLMDLGRRGDWRKAVEDIEHSLCAGANKIFDKQAYESRQKPRDGPRPTKQRLTVEEILRGTKTVAT